MNNKILTIGSITLAIILILVTFTSVVGFQAVKPDNVKASPLFDVRSKRAIGEESKILNSNYLRKGQLISFPVRDREVEFEMIINILKGMDDKSFDKFVERVISYIHQNNEIHNIAINDKELEDMLYQLRDNSELIENNIMLIENKEPPQLTIHITSWECILLFLLILFSFPFVVIITIIRFIFDIIRFIFEIIRDTNPSLPTIN